MKNQTNCVEESVPLPKRWPLSYAPCALKKKFFFRQIKNKYNILILELHFRNFGRCHPKPRGKSLGLAPMLGWTCFGGWSGTFRGDSLTLLPTSYPIYEPEEEICSSCWWRRERIFPICVSNSWTPASRAWFLACSSKNTWT